VFRFFTLFLIISGFAWRSDCTNEENEGNKADFHNWSTAPLLTHMFLPAPFFLRGGTGVFTTEKAPQDSLRHLLILEKKITSAQKAPFLLASGENNHSGSIENNQF